MFILMPWNPPGGRKQWKYVSRCKKMICCLLDDDCTKKDQRNLVVFHMCDNCKLKSSLRAQLKYLAVKSFVL